MLKRKDNRQKGKLSLSRYFQKLSPGDSVAVVRELAIPFGYLKRIQGRPGVVKAKRGSAFEVRVKELNKPKTYFIQPVHLKKIEVSK